MIHIFLPLKKKKIDYPKSKSIKLIILFQIYYVDV